MAWNGTEFLVAWQLAPDGVYNLFATRVSVDGVPLGAPIALTTSNSGLGNESPSLAAGKDGVGVAWFLGDALSKTISFQIFSTDLAKPTIPPMVLTDGSTNAVYPTVVWNKDRYIVAWADTSAKPAAIYATAIGPDGSMLVPPKPITNPGIVPLALAVPEAARRSPAPHLLGRSRRSERRLRDLLADDRQRARSDRIRAADHQRPAATASTRSPRSGRTGTSASSSATIARASKTCGSPA